MVSLDRRIGASVPVAVDVLALTASSTEDGAPSSAILRRRVRLAVRLSAETFVRELGGVDGTE
jgi:hypothetical protein